MNIYNSEAASGWLAGTRWLNALSEQAWTTTFMSSAEGSEPASWTDKKVS
jgi:hypothetical protein